VSTNSFRFTRYDQKIPSIESQSAFSGISGFHVCPYGRQRFRPADATGPFKQAETVDLPSTHNPQPTAHRTVRRPWVPQSECCQNLPLPIPISDSQQPETNPHSHSSSFPQYHGLALLSFLSVDFDGGPDWNDCLSDLSLHIPFIPTARGTRINHLQRQSSHSIVGQERRRTGSAPPAIGRGTHQGDHSRTLRLVWGTGSCILYRSITVGRRRSNGLL
jgi:hypothetical protein